mgnify:CR=1 FL=1
MCKQFMQVHHKTNDETLLLNITSIYYTFLGARLWLAPGDVHVTPLRVCALVLRFTDRSVGQTAKLTTTNAWQNKGKQLLFLIFIFFN